ncbi:unnamed protein product [Victoria cruziana]
MGSGTEVIVIPFHGQGHVFPCAQLSLQLAIRGISVTVASPPELSSSISAACDHPLVSVVVLSLPPNPPDAPRHQTLFRSRLMAEPFAELLGQRTSRDASGPPRPVCVIFDAHCGWAVEVCRRHGIPTAAFFTNGTCACTLEYIGYYLPLETMNPDDFVVFEGLPESLQVTYADLSNQRPSIVGTGGPRARVLPPWMPEVDGATAFLFNTCNELEGPFTDCMARQAGKKAFGIGPLLPPQIWQSAGAPLHDGAVRAKKSSNISEEDVEAWLDRKPPGSVIFVSFGSEVSPSSSEIAALAAGLAQSTQPFIWVIQAQVQMASSRATAGRPEPTKEPWLSLVPEGFEERVGERGLVIRGWAPQLLILSHRSTGGFVSHCGWNSTLESLACGVPILAWPVRGDQNQNAILVVNHLKVGVKVRRDRNREVSKEDVVTGVERLMGDAEIRNRAAQIKAIFSSGLPSSSSSALDAFIHLLVAA